MASILAEQPMNRASARKRDDRSCGPQCAVLSHRNQKIAAPAALRRQTGRYKPNFPSFLPGLGMSLRGEDAADRRPLRPSDGTCRQSLCARNLRQLLCDVTTGIEGKARASPRREGCVVCYKCWHCFRSSVCGIRSCAVGLGSPKSWPAPSQSAGWAHRGSHPQLIVPEQTFVIDPQTEIIRCTTRAARPLIFLLQIAGNSSCKVTTDVAKRLSL